MFKHLNLQTRLMSAFVFMGVIVFIVALVGWFSSSSMNHYVNTFSKNALPTVSSFWAINEGQTQIQSAERLLFDSEITEVERQSALTQISEGWKQIENGIRKYEATPSVGEQEDKIYQQFQQSLAAWKLAHEHLLEIEEKFHQLNIRNPWRKQMELLAQGKENSPDMAAVKTALVLRSQMDSEGSSKEEPLFRATDEDAAKLLELYDGVAEETQKQADQSLSQSVFWVLLGVIIGPLTAILFGIFLSRTIARPFGAKIAKVVNVAEHISAGDLTTQVEASSGTDEVGKLQNAFHIMTQNLKNLIRQVQQSGIQVNTSSTKLAASGKQLEATISEQVASTNEVAATAKEIAATSEELAKTMETIVSASETTAQSAVGSQKSLESMELTMQHLAKATNSISTRLEVISEKAGSINDVVATITKVADQTNLLSLNAAIEAEKAGEYGVGFAVVAREIRRLADQTAVATLDIERMVKEMHSSVSTGVMEMDKFTKEVAQGVGIIGAIGQELGQIIEEVQAFTPRFATVNQGMEAQAQGAQQISEAMMQLSDTSVQTAESLREINSAIAQLNQASHGLQQEISHFKINTLEPLRSGR
jgi:methyl-accepting chemotaxis protein WspA